MKTENQIEYRQYPQVRILGLKPLFKRIPLLLLLISPFFILLYYVALQPHVDFAYFYYAFQVVWDKLPRSLLYDMTSQRHWFVLHGFKVYPDNQYVYPPQFAVFFSWLAALPIRVATRVWAFLSLVCYLVGVFIIFPLVHPQKRVLQRVLFYLLALLNAPFWWDITIGNTNWLIFFTLALGIYLLYVKQTPWLAGIAFGFSIVFKVSPTILIFYFLIRREWKVVSSVLFTILISTVASIFVVGVKPFLFYASHLSTMTATSMKNGNAPYNSSLLGVLGYLNQHHAISLSQSSLHPLFVIYLCVLTLTLGIALYNFPKSPMYDKRIDISIGLIAILLYSPLVEGPHLIVIYLATWLLFGAWWDRLKKFTRKTWRNMVFGLTYLILWSALSPLGLSLRDKFPTEDFLIMMGVLVVTVWLSLAHLPGNKFSKLDGN